MIASTAAAIGRVMKKRVRTAMNILRTIVCGLRNRRPIDAWFNLPVCG